MLISSRSNFVNNIHFITTSFLLLKYSRNLWSGWHRSRNNKKTFSCGLVSNKFHSEMVSVFGVQLIVLCLICLKKLNKVINSRMMMTLTEQIIQIYKNEFNLKATVAKLNCFNFFTCINFKNDHELQICFIYFLI